MHMDNEEMEVTHKIDKEETLKSKISSPSSLCGLSQSDEMNIIGESSKSKMDENNKNSDLSSQDLSCIPDFLFYNSEVKELDLSNNYRLAEEKELVFPELKYLRKLNLSNCNLKNIPNELAKCEHLEVLNVSHNLLQFDFNLSTLENLKNLNLSNCDLGIKNSGLLSTLYNCSRLEELNLSNNPLKELYGFRLAHKLKKLDLSGCGITDLPDVCHKLEELNLSMNHLKFSAVCNMTHRNLPCLKKLDLSGCGLVELPDEFGYIYFLEKLNLSNNPLSYSAISNLSYWNLCELKMLELSGCGLTELPDEFRCTYFLEELDLSNNPLSFSAISSLTYWDLHRLKNLDLSSCGLTNLPGRDLPYLCGLNELNLSNNPLKHLDTSNVIHSNFCSLEKLVLCGCDLTDLPDDLCDFPKLEDLDLSNNPLEFSAISSLTHRRLFQLKKLDLSNCGLTDLPDDLGFWYELGELNLSNNPLGLSAISNLTHWDLFQLRKLDLSSCGLTELPDDLCYCFKLEELDLSNNPLDRPELSKRLKIGRIQPSLKVFPEDVVIRKRLKSYYSDEDIREASPPVTTSDERDPELPTWPVYLGRASSFILEGCFKSSKLLSSCSSSNSSLGSAGSSSSSPSKKPRKRQRRRAWQKRHESRKRWKREKNDKLTIDARRFFMSLDCPGKLAESGVDDKTSITDVAMYSDSVITIDGQNSDKSITVDEKGGCFHIIAASAFLVFPPRAVEEQITLMCYRVSYKECEVKPGKEELFVGRILKIEPKGVMFRKPVTVLLSHSIYEDENFLDFYELIVKSLSLNGCQELKTERISSLEDVPKEILSMEIISDYLPFAKATILTTCTLVAATQFKSDQVSVPTNSKERTFSKKYGENKKMEIKFPAVVTEDSLCLTIQLLPPDVVFNRDVYLDNDIVCLPAIKVSGQTNPFVKPVHVELTYSHHDVAGIEKDFLPVGIKIKFTTEYGLLLHSHKSRLECEIFNESNDVYIERLRKDQLQLSFSIGHFCEITPAVKKTASTQLPNVEESSIVNHCLKPDHKFFAFVFAVHDCEINTLYAVVAPQNQIVLNSRERELKVTGKRFGPRLKCEEKIYICVPLENDIPHLPLEDCVLWFDQEWQYELSNRIRDDLHLEEEYMYFLEKECTGENHNFRKDGRAKVTIHSFGKKSEKETVTRADEPFSNIESKLSTDGPPSQEVADKCQITLQNEETITPGDEPSSNIESKQSNDDPPSQEVTYKSQIILQKEVLVRNISRFKSFEEKIESKFLAKLKINKNQTKNPDVGEITKAISDAGALTSIVLGLGVGATLALSIGSFGIPAIVGATVAGVTFTVTKVEKKLKKCSAKCLDKKLEIYFFCHLKFIIKDVAKELSRIFEFQILSLKDDTQVEILAESAVDLMLDLKKGDEFGRNTLLKKVLREGSIKKRELLTKNDDEWFAPDVFRKPGLLQTNLGTDRAEFKYFVKQKKACNTQTYGYRGQFLEIKKYEGQVEEEEKVQVVHYRKRDSEEQTHGHYFVESSIDSDYSEPREELLKYHPIHILVQCPEVLDSFIGSLQAEKLSLANFLKNKLELPKDHLVHPVYRQNTPGKAPDLKKSILTGSDLSHCDFTNCSLEECDFTKCVMLFAELAGAKMSGSTFKDTLISHSNLVGVQADNCEWTKTSLLFSRVDGADLGSVEPTICGNCLNGTNICDAITGKKREINANECK